MTTDRELLEAAAKAIELRVYDWLPGRAGFAHGDSITNRWNPLENDGDALRLAVKLRMNVFHAGVRVHAMDEEGDIEAAEGHERDPYAATRRAIVRAAAAMGATK